MENYERIREIALSDVTILEEKGQTYGDSWKKRGGIGAFMQLARKWDRIENICTSMNYDVFAAGRVNMGDILDDIGDLRRYLLLVQAEVYARNTVAPAPSPFQPVAPQTAQLHPEMQSRFDRTDK